MEFVLNKEETLRLVVVSNEDGVRSMKQYSVGRQSNFFQHVPKTAGDSNGSLYFS
jgi:hypothetical protein